MKEFVYYLYKQNQLINIKEVYLNSSSGVVEQKCFETPLMVQVENYIRNKDS